MSTILIDRNSIKRKPEPPPFKGMTVSGTCFGEYPLCIQDAVITTGYTGWGACDELYVEQDFICINPEQYLRLFQVAKHIKHPALHMRIERDTPDFTCRDNDGAFWFGPSSNPRDRYDFNYENTPVECSECHTLVPKDEIEDDYLHNEDGDEFSVEVCPNCGEINSFHYEYERPEDVIKE